MEIIVLVTPAIPPEIASFRGYQITGQGTSTYLETGQCNEEQEQRVSDYWLPRIGAENFEILGLNDLPSVSYCVTDTEMNIAGDFLTPTI